MSVRACACDVFISYCRADEKIAYLLRDELETFKITYYLDQESGKTGDEWLKQIQAAIDGSKYFALIFSDSSNRSTYVRQEVERAASISRRGWIMLDKSEPRPEIKNLLGRINACVAYKQDEETAVRDFATSIARALWKPAVLRRGPAKLSHALCPYRPYRSYEKSDKLFGRESEIRDITASIYEALSPEVDPQIDMKRSLIFAYGPSGAGKSSLIASGVLPDLAKDDSVHIIGPLRVRSMLQNADPTLQNIEPTQQDVKYKQQNFEWHAAKAGGKRCVIAVDQFEEIWPEYNQDLPAATKKLIENIPIALNHFEKLVILLGFREEYLAKIEDLFLPAQKRLRRHAVRPLNKGDADDCLRGPAAEQNIFYEDQLAAALIQALAKTADSRGANGEEIVYVQPVELQIVCDGLWKELPEDIQDIHSAHLLSACDQLGLSTHGRKADEVDYLARIFFEHVTQGFLDGAVAEISASETARAANYNSPERIFFALRQFVSDTRKRIGIKAHTDQGRGWVGRLPMSIVHEMSDRHLLGKAVDTPGEERYELVHDRLAERIMEKKEQMDLYYAATSLGSELTKVKQKHIAGLAGWFEDYESTVKDVTEFKDFQGLNPEEAEFILRSALAYGKDKRKDLEEWAGTLAEQHPRTLAGVFHDAFSTEQKNGQARMNAAMLLRRRWLQAKLARAGELAPILVKVRMACERTRERARKYRSLDAELNDLNEVYEKKKKAMEGKPHSDILIAKLHADYECDVKHARKTSPDDELEELCYTLSTCPVVTGCDHFEDLLSGASDLSQVDTRILLWMRDKTNMGRGGCFAKRWKALPAGRRGRLTLQLFWLRFRKAFLRMTLIVFLCTVATSAGAAAMFIPWGYFGASFTEASSVSGAGQGIFHGVFGGLIWGSFTSAATLFYWLVLRGRHIEKKFSHWVCGVLLTGLAGLLGGVLLAIMVLNVDAKLTMKDGGWLNKGLDLSVYADAFANPIRAASHDQDHGNGWGWILPTYGLFMGLGVGWAMLNLYHDKNFRRFARDQHALTSGPQFANWFSKILGRTIRWGGPPAAGLGLAAALVFVAYQGHQLDCRPYQWNWGKPATRCADKPADKPPVIHKPDGTTVIGTTSPWTSQGLAPLEWRSVGMGMVILAGAYAMTISYLLSLLTIRFGVEVAEDIRFMGVDEEQTSDLQLGSAVSS